MTGTGLLAGAIAIALTTTAAAAQRIELSPFAGFQFGGRLPLQGGDLTVANAANVGATVSIRLAPTALLDFTYSRQETALEREDGSDLFDLSVEYIHLGVSYDDATGVGIRPFATITGGVTRFAPLSSDRASETFPSGSFGGGIKSFVTKNIGVKLQGRFLFTVLRSRTQTFCAPGLGGACLGAMQATILPQGNVTGSVFVAF